MPASTANGLTIAYEEYGNPTDPVILLIHGLSTPLTGWPTLFVNTLVSRGYRVIALDNRDIGQSQILDHLSIPNLVGQLIRKKLRMKLRVPYSLSDMMEDARGLLDSLSIPKACVVGASMGGMIAQRLAIHHPERVSSLVSIMSSTSNRALPRTEKHVAKHMLSPPKSANREDIVAHNIKTWQLIGSPGYPMEENERRKYVEGLLDRGITRNGSTRHYLAIMAEPDRRALLNQLKVPTLVIHGHDDPLVPVACGEDTAHSIPDATLKLFDGMGHDLPDALVPAIVDLIHDHIQSTGR